MKQTEAYPKIKSRAKKVGVSLQELAKHGGVTYQTLRLALLGERPSPGLIAHVDQTLTALESNKPIPPIRTKARPGRQPSIRLVPTEATT